MTALDHPGGGGGRGETQRLAIFRLVPTAARDDRRFARDALHGELVVRARSIEDARAVAIEAEQASRGGGARPAVSKDSPFRDETLYTVIEVSGVEFLKSGKRGLIAGRFAEKPVAG